jgi:hypothetical protein
MLSDVASDDFVAEFAVEGFKLAFRDNGLGRNLKQGPRKVQQAAYITAQRDAPRVENYMKTNAPWEDQTGNARSGLFARAYIEGDEIGIVLGHTVPYGIWLEVRFNGRYSIIQPAIDAMGPVVMRDFSRLMDRL